MGRILITGSSDGLGLMAARLLVEDGHAVTLHARTDFPKEERRLLRRCTVEGEPIRE